MVRVQSARGGVVSAPTGYFRAVFDGRYVYFVPHLNPDESIQASGEVLRLDTTAEFATPQSWSVFDPGDHGIGTDPDGFAGAVFDGRYIYFVPLDAVGGGEGYNGEVIRYDTQSDFLQASSWSAYDSAVHGTVAQPHGYVEAAYDGRYVYFGPYLRQGLIPYSQVLRYDTQLGFQDALAWNTFDPGAQGVGQTPGGYRGVVYDCKNVYFVPFLVDYGSRTFHSETLRYDTKREFQSIDAWSAYNPVTAGSWNIPQGYDGAVFDGRYIYFVPPTIMSTTAPFCATTPGSELPTLRATVSLIPAKASLRSSSQARSRRLRSAPLTFTTSRPPIRMRVIR